MQLIRFDVDEAPGSSSCKSFYNFQRIMFPIKSRIYRLYDTCSDMCISIICNRNTQFKLKCDAMSFYENFEGNLHTYDGDHTKIISSIIFSRRSEKSSS